MNLTVLNLVAQVSPCRVGIHWEYFADVDAYLVTLMVDSFEDVRHVREVVLTAEISQPSASTINRLRSEFLRDLFTYYSIGDM